MSEDKIEDFENHAIKTAIEKILKDPTESIVRQTLDYVAENYHLYDMSTARYPHFLEKEDIVGLLPEILKLIK